jgi:DNA-binding CsgD family transcriptional regulator
MRSAALAGAPAPQPERGDEHRPPAHRATVTAFGTRIEHGVRISAGPDIRLVSSRCSGRRGIASVQTRLLEGGPEPLLEATELARRGGRALDHAATCEDSAAVLVDAGRPEEATLLLIGAQSRYDDMGATAWSARVAASLRSLGVRRGARGRLRRAETGWESLTASERSVSELVAQGLTNREVARRLHISPHTVNTHLRHVFQMTRAELAAMIARRAGNNKIMHSSDVLRGNGRTS